MTDKPNVGQEGAPEAKPGVSDGSVAGAEQLMELVKSLTGEVKTLKSEIGGIYSRQDKDRNAFREFMDEYNRQKSRGLGESEAMSAAEDYVNERKAASSQAQMLKELYEKLVSSGTGAVDPAGVFAKAGLNMDDPEVIALKSRSYGSEAEVYQALGEYYVSKSEKPNPNPAQEVSSTRSTGQPPKQEALIDELNSLYRDPNASVDRINALEKQLGWN